MAISRLARRTWSAGAGLILLALPLCARAVAQSDTLAEGAQSDTLTADEVVAEQLQDPVASLSSIPLLNTFDFGLGTASASRYTLSIVPNVALRFGSWVGISRTELPFIARGPFVPGGGNVSGIGDITETILLTPWKPTLGSDFGIGLVMLFPAASLDNGLGRNKWAIGPSAVIDNHSGHWTYGVQGNHQWSFAGSGTSDINSTAFGAFVARSWPSGFTINTSFDPTRDWENHQWTVPVLLGATTIVHLGAQRASVGGAARVFLEGPAGAPSWGFRLIFTSVL